MGNEVVQIPGELGALLGARSLAGATPALDAHPQVMQR
jgi:hypothetical protein